MPTKEWSDGFNSFNSWKGLTYINYYKAIAAWGKGLRSAPLPPIEISLDLFQGCQLHCSHCNASRYLESDKTNIRMPDEHLMKLIHFFSSWGAKGLCFGGGGESTLHTKLPEALILSESLKLQTSIATNGIVMNDSLLDAMLTCRWIGISVDSATDKTYAVGRKVNFFDTVIKNIEKLARNVKQNKSKCDVAYKFLIFDYNQHEIFVACKLD